MSPLKNAVIAWFRRPAGLGGRVAGHLMATRRSNRTRNAETIRILALRRGERVLEVGCGPGLALAAAAAAVGPDGEVVGLDHSPLMLGQARRRVGRITGGAPIRLVLGDMERAAEWAGTFDAVLSVNVIQFAPDREAAIAKLAGALVPGGRLVTTLQPRLSRPAPRELDRLATSLADETASAGLVDIVTETVPLAPVPAVIVRGCRPASERHPSGADGHALAAQRSHEMVGGQCEAP